jgi:hypothetical protein
MHVGCSAGNLSKLLIFTHVYVKPPHVEAAESAFQTLSSPHQPKPFLSSSTHSARDPLHLLVAEDSEALLEGELEPVAARDPVAGPVVEVLVRNHRLHSLEVSVRRCTVILLSESENHMQWSSTRA